MREQVSAAPLDGAAPERDGRTDSVDASRAHGPGHAIGASPWPAWFAASSLVAFLGLTLAQPVLFGGGLVLLAAATVCWGAEAAGEWRAKEHGATSSAGPTTVGWGRAFAGFFLAVVAASALGGLVAAAQPSRATAAAASPSPSPSVGASPSTGPGAGPTIPLVAHNIAFGTTSLTAPSNTPFTIAFDNQDASVPHNVQIKDANGQSVFRGQIVTGPTTIAYQVPALAAGTYTFVCDVHPTTMTGTLTVQ